MCLAVSSLLINIVFRLIFNILYSCLFNSSLLDLASCQFISLMPLQSSIVFTVSWHLIISVDRFLLSSQHYYFHLSQCLKYLWMITTEWHQRLEIYIVQTSVCYFKLSELRPHRTENPKDRGRWGKIWTETRDANLKNSTSKEGTVLFASISITRTTDWSVLVIYIAEIYFLRVWKLEI